ncbi:hypothetical protein BDN67DRAFT_972027, partial [Paxillus ammoniavirescens]
MLLASNALVVRRDGNNTEYTPTFKGFAFIATVTPMGSRTTNEALTTLTIADEFNPWCTLQK